MRVPLRCLTLAVLLADFALAAMLPTLFILAQGSRWAGPGRYRGALEASRKLVRIVAWIVRGKVLYGFVLVAALLAGWVKLPWLAVILLVALLLAWEIGFEVTQTLGRFIRERQGAEAADQSSPAGATGPNRAAKWVLLAGALTVLAEVALFLGVFIHRLFVID